MLWPVDFLLPFLHRPTADSDTVIILVLLFLGLVGPARGGRSGTGVLASAALQLAYRSQMVGRRNILHWPGRGLSMNGRRHSVGPTHVTQRALFAHARVSW